MTRRAWIGIASAFLFGVASRSLVLFHRPVEGDERIFQALVEQLEAGNGYTLRGHRILDKPWLSRDVYDRPVFHHPPGGILLFWLARRALGESGYAAVELFGYLLFFAGMLGLAAETGAGEGETCVVAALAALTPVVGFAGCWFWLDVPMAGFATASAALFLRAARTGRRAELAAAAALLGAATWIRSLAFLAAPGAFALAAALRPADRAKTLRAALWYAGVASVLHAPWTVWHAYRSAGALPLPTATLLERSRYVRIIAGRSAWSYVTMLPRVFYTFLPSILVWAALKREPDLRRRGGALLAWVGVVVVSHILLGALGFPKVMRYVILAAPACILLAAMSAAAAWRTPRWELRAVVVVGLVAELYQGLLVFFDPVYRNSVFFETF